MNYRREIDGIRALAVVPVILFHAGFSVFKGGYVGVDIFFVISGFLITSIISAQLEVQQFSFITFYERRARRILPALFFVMLVCLPFAWYWLLPNDLKNFSQSLAAVSKFTSNVFFYTTSNYFDTASDVKPLLHTWSLAVEEQFYFLFPALLAIFLKAGRKWTFVFLLSLFLYSFSTRYFGPLAKVAESYFLLETRGWELILGSFVAMYIKEPINHFQHKDTRAFLAFVGFVLILSSVLFFSKNTPYPSFYTLLPTCGTALIILFADEDNYVGRFLGNKFLVKIGLISYSAYLWHQPIFAFARVKNSEEPGTLLFLALIGLTFALSFMTWKVIEQPFRTKNIFSRRSIFTYALAGSLSFNILGNKISEDPFLGMSLSDIEKSQLLVNYRDDKWDLTKKHFKEGTQGKRLLIIGDSYAEDFHKALYMYKEDEYERLDVVGIEVSRRCKNVLSSTPLLNQDLYKSDLQCFDNIKRVDHLDYVSTIKAADLIIVRSCWDDLPTFEMPKLYDYILHLNKNVIFLGSTVFGDFKKGDKANFLNEISKELDATKEMPYSKSGKYNLIELIEIAPRLMGERNYFDIEHYFCKNPVKCNIYDAEGRLQTPDGGHLTDFGKKTLIENLFNDPKFLSLWLRLDLKN